MQTLLIGIDDTDNLETRGTGYHARQLMDQLHKHNLAQVTGVTRHQLFFDDRVPYTSHNSSACLSTLFDGDIDTLVNFCKTFMLSIAAEGSDVGLCIANTQQAEAATDFGHRAKTEIVTQSQAQELADKMNIHLYGLTGDHQGIIGALSACGLFVDGNDGRYIWAKGVREHANETLPMHTLINVIGIDQVSVHNGNRLTVKEATIALGPWPRPIRKNNQSELLVEKIDENRYQVLGKDIIKAIRP